MNEFILDLTVDPPTIFIVAKNELVVLHNATPEYLDDLVAELRRRGTVKVKKG
jgi:DNA-binding IscR family transcriptional regulator